MVGQSCGEPFICWQLKCIPRLGSQRYTRSIHKAKERETPDNSSIRLGCEQPTLTSLALIPSRVWNPGFPFLSSVLWRSTTHTVLSFWFKQYVIVDTQNSNLSNTDTLSRVLLNSVLRTLYLKAGSPHPSPCSEAGSKAFETVFLTSPKNILLLDRSTNITIFLLCGCMNGF